MLMLRSEPGNAIIMFVANDYVSSGHGSHKSTSQRVLAVRAPGRRVHAIGSPALAYRKKIVKNPRRPKISATFEVKILFTQVIDVDLIWIQNDHVLTARAIEGPYAAEANVIDRYAHHPPACEAIFRLVTGIIDFVYKDAN